MATRVESNWHQRVFATFEQAKDFFQATTQHTKSLSLSTKSAVNSITTAAEQAVDTVSTTAKDSLEQSWQQANRYSGAMSNAMQTAISDSVSNWLQAHPLVGQLVQLLLWATDHPVISLVMLLVTIAITWSLIKAIGRLMETIGWNLLQAPFKLTRVLLGFSTKLLGNARNQPQPEYDTQQQRLAEIHNRLEYLHKEQNELLQELAAILSLKKINP